MSVTLSDPGRTEWSFTCVTAGTSMNPPPGGLVLQQVIHDGHNFARDIRVIGFWLEMEELTFAGAVTPMPKQFFLLDATNFTASPISVLRPSPMSMPTTGRTFAYLREVDTALDFKEYFKDSSGNYVAFGVKAEFSSATFFSRFANCELAGLTIEQIFLFSAYGNTPPHEPSGALSAARCHPIVKYQTTANPTVNRALPVTRIRNIRFDYRLHLYIDRHHDAATNRGLPQLGNQAGLFADSDSLANTTARAIGSTLWNRSTSAGVSYGAFEGVEKPVVLEVTAPGLANGFPLYSSSPTPRVSAPIRCWDNVHWWGARGTGAPLISAPGAFHAAHIHWRWGAAATIQVGGNPRFQGNWPTGQAANPVTAGKWGPVVDPNIWMQTIRIAIVTNDPRLDPARAPAANLTRADWKTLFDPGLGRAPADISAGDDIVLWYSVEVPREVTVPGFSTFTGTSHAVTPPTTYSARSPGTMFLSGIFFAHDAERTGFGVGTTGPAHRPRSESAIRTPPRQWFRPGN